MDAILEVSLQRQRGVPVVVVKGEIDVATAPTLRAKLLELGDERTVVLDLGEVSFLDSTGIGVLLGALKRLRAAHEDAALRLCGVRSQVRKVLEVTGLDAVFSMFDSVEEAVVE